MFPDMVYPEKNWSSVVCNNEKGESIVSGLKRTMIVRSCSLSDVIEYNPLFARQTWFSKDRDKFFADFVNNKKDAISRWTKPPTYYKPSIRRKVLYVCPSWLISMIKSFYNLIRK